MHGYKIGDLAERAGTNAPTIRYYEQIGLLRPPARERGGQRRYGDDDVRRLTIIRRCRDFGFSIAQVRSMMALRDADRPCAEACEISRAHLSSVRAKLRELRALEKDIARFVERSETACKGTTARDCSMIEDLARPASRSKARSRPRNTLAAE